MHCFFIKQLGITDIILKIAFIIPLFFNLFTPFDALGLKNYHDSEASESYRLSFALGKPRRYETRYQEATRELQLRITPARQEEFNETKFYDNRFIHRIVVQEKNNQVILSIQLKDEDFGWIVTNQESPWRILVDIWPMFQPDKRSLEQEWRWSGSLSSLDEQKENVKGVSSSSLPSNTWFSSSSSYSETISNGPSAGKLEAGGTIQATEIINSQNKKETHKKSNDTNKHNINAATEGPLVSESKLLLPAILGRIDPYVSLSNKQLTDLEINVGQYLGTGQDFDAQADLARRLYVAGNVEKSIKIYRFMSAMSEQKFKQNPNLLWFAGESAFLNGNIALAADYFRSLILHHPGHSLRSLAQIRLIDIGEAGRNFTSDAQDIIKYSNIALSEDNLEAARIVATLRVLAPSIDKDPESASLYIGLLDACITKGLVTKALSNQCYYQKLRYLFYKDNILTVDEMIQTFKKLEPKDPRNATLETMIEARVKVALNTASQNQKWFDWIELEKKIRPALLKFSIEDPQALFKRAEAWKFVGDNERAIRLYENYLSLGKDDKQAREASVSAAFLLYKISQASRAEKLLAKLVEDPKTVAEGFNGESIAILHKISLPPYSSMRGLSLLISEMRQGRYHEDNLNSLVIWAKAEKDDKNLAYLFQLIIAFVPKNDDDITTMTEALMSYGDLLRIKGLFQKSGDVFATVGNLAGSKRQAEANYKAGIVYARARDFEKAKKYWQLSSNDVSDKRFSELASERLQNLE